ncbi:unnamed protein product [Strongylus vulgaris]|uniref:Saposin B-type domain-containing protein n=1 Tax=Strongylus vulgaris TaxID=40348 RepID=A0A3P7JTB9_STRVU|nr:unnamed protein product [Strongylus vulgaris]
MRTALTAVVTLSIITSLAAAYRKKPLCEMCEGLIQKIDEILEKGGDIEEAVDEFCREDVPSFLVDYCEKIISKNLKYIIEKLKVCRLSSLPPLQQFALRIYNVVFSLLNGNSYLQIWIAQDYIEHDPPEKICTDIHLGAL